MLFAFIDGLSGNTSALLIFCVVAVCFFEAINGFHDTANAVATVIYTKTLPPVTAVIWSGCWNFLGAFLGGTAVAMGIVKLVPLNDLMAVPLSENMALVFAVLITAIFWNLGTWYIGLPNSSSHTLIGSLLGAGLAFWSVHGGKGINWEKAQDIGLSLLISPLFGFSLAILLMFLLKTTIKKKTIFKEPDPEKAPPIWIRATLIGTCTLVSYFHGNNDGQKGVGLMLVVLMGFLPLQFAFNPDIKPAEMSGSVRKIETALLGDTLKTPEHTSSLKALAQSCEKSALLLDSVDTKRKESVFAARKSVQDLNKKLESTLEAGFIQKETATVIKAEVKQAKKAYEYSPFWVVLIISVCLGAGTMVGWKRIVVTIGEKIGKTHLTYAQGASAELCAAATIGVSSWLGLPVSTTHVLSSGIAGTMVAQGGVSNLRRKTIRNIALAWILTLPVTMLMGAALFYCFRAIF
jgi:inorganic phosphate transporter, PiT family